jgi:hypothetical protein
VIAALLASLAQSAAPAPIVRPGRTDVPFETARVIGRPSASARHALLARGPGIPAGGIAFTARCLVARDDGRAFGCAAPDVPEAWRSAAVWLASLYRFDLTGLPLGPDERTLTVTIADRIVPEDVRPADRLFRYAAPAAGNVVLASGLGQDQLMAYYPVPGLRANEQPLVNVDCQVQPDLSLFCLNAGVARGSPLTDQASLFALATYQILGSARAAPALDNGAPAAGTIFRQTLQFRIPGE